MSVGPENPFEHEPDLTGVMSLNGLLMRGGIVEVSRLPDGRYQGEVVYKESWRVPIIADPEMDVKDAMALRHARPRLGVSTDSPDKRPRSTIDWKTIQGKSRTGLLDTGSAYPVRTKHKS